MSRGLAQQVRREEAGLLRNRHKPIPITEVARQKGLEGTGSRHGRNRTRIHAPAQERANRHIADQLPLDRILEKEPKALPASLLGQILLRAKIKVPISPALDSSILDRDRMPRL